MACLGPNARRASKERKLLSQRENLLVPDDWTGVFSSPANGQGGIQIFFEPWQKYFSRQLTPKAQKERQHSTQLKKFKTFSEANNTQTGSQKTTFPDELSDN